MLVALANRFQRLARMIVLHEEVAQPSLAAPSQYRLEVQPAAPDLGDLAPLIDVLQVAKAEATAYLDALVRDLQNQGVAQVSRVVVYEEPAGQIIKLAGATANSMVAMCTHGRSGVQRWALGSITEKVARHSSAPVLVIRAATGAT
jgi:nucleotide-binding universal stress UspA family protein